MTAHHEASPKDLGGGTWGARIWSDDPVAVGDSVTITTKAGVSRDEYVSAIVETDRKLKIVRTSEEPPLGWPDPSDPPVDVVGTSQPGDSEFEPWPEPEPRVPFPPREETPQYPSEPRPAPSPPGFAGDVQQLARDLRDACNRFLGED